jgi:hypothetical protein
MDIDHLRALLSGERQEPVIVGHIYDPALSRVIRAVNTHAVLLSRDTVVKQAKRHPDIGIEQYALLPYVLRYGMVAQEWAEQLIFCWDDHDGRRYRLMVKGTVRKEIFVTSFHRLAEKQTKRIIDRGAMLLRRHA